MEENVIHRTKRLSEIISDHVEHRFYWLGFHIALHPMKWLLGCVLIILLCLSGLLFFRQEKNPMKLWVPPDSDFIRDTEWLMSNFQEGRRIETMILVDDDVLRPSVLVKLNEITKRVMDIKSWQEVCLEIPVLPKITTRRKRTSDLYCKIYNNLPRGCALFSILDIWNYNTDLIQRQTKNDIIEKFNQTKISPIFGHRIEYEQLLGGIVRDDSGKILSAKAIKTNWIVRVNYSNIDMNKLGNDAGTADWATENVLKWESEYLKVLKNESNLYYQAGRSFGDISSTTTFKEMDKLMIGMIFMFCYVLTILSRFNRIEIRLWLTITGLLCVGGAFIIAVGTCSFLGIPYGPVHTSLPFMLLGLGIDDIFIMMTSWKSINARSENKEKLLPEKIGLTLSHAGSAISITSLTDVVAFIIGSSTILPALKSFCIYAAVGVLITFLLQITFFLACFVIDVKRVNNRRDGIFPCIVHESVQISPPTNHTIYPKILLTPFGKILVLSLTILFVSFGIVGTFKLEQRFDPQWFLPESSYLNEYINTRNQYFTSQHQGFILIDQINYSNEFSKIIQLTETLSNVTFVHKIDNWPEELSNYVKTNFHRDLTNDSTITELQFHQYLSEFLFTPIGGRYQKNFLFDGQLKCGRSTPKIKLSTIDFSFPIFNGPDQWIPAMDEVKLLMSRSNVRGFVWSKMFGTWVTDKSIAQEVYRNLILALVCVMATTTILIAELQTCFWITLCVLLTLLNVCGFMYFWGMTIDVVSCIGLELAIGLSVDYAAHVAHAFLKVQHPQNNKTARALVAIENTGSAVLYGAGSTLLALSMLVFSKAYVFRSFFKIFFLVVVFGLWHGLLFLPVVLSTIGPDSIQ